MTIKLVGSVLVILGCGGFGFSVAAAQKREVRLFQQIIRVLDYLSCELQYRLTPLPQLCRQASLECTGALNRLLSAFAKELDTQIAPNAELCMKAALSQTHDLPDSIHTILLTLGHSLGRFDLDGQLSDLENVRELCTNKLAALNQNKEVRMRTYQTLGLCVGAALVILFI